ncbi:MAG: hypothetical protein GXP25_06575 [Planctomycetes bacterium]|nr:hypothetical protein [Planctomycetota bacterium]
MEKRVKPINLLDSAILRPERLAVIDAVKEVMTLAHVSKAITLHDYGCWRHQQWRNEENALVPFLSVDWYVANAWDQSRMQVNGEILLTLLEEEPWRRPELLGEHYDILILDEDLYTTQPDWPDDFIVAIARADVGTAISTHRLGTHPFTILKTVVMHQLAHVFGVPQHDRNDLDHRWGAHCTHDCVMRYPEKTPEDWEALTMDRFRQGPFCEGCLRDLRQFFAAEKDSTAAE